MITNETVVYSLPAIWASYLINGDSSGLRPEEKQQADDFLARRNLPMPVSCSEESQWKWHHDASPETWVDGAGGEVLDFTFLLPQQVLRMKTEGPEFEAHREIAQRIDGRFSV